MYDPDTAIRGFELFVRGGHDAHFTMLGHGPLARHLETLTGQLGIACRVTRLGVISDASAIAQHLRGADVYLSTAVSDGASASLFEAMACGAFPVVADIPANREWITHGRNGLLFPPGDAVALANALTSAFDSAALRDAAVDVNTELVQRRLDRGRNSAVMVEIFTRMVQTHPLRARRPAELFVHGALIEASGNVLLEAMAAGLPIVCTDAGGPSEYVADGVAGLIVPPADPKAMANRMRLLLEGGPLREQLGRQGRQRAKAHFC